MRTALLGDRFSEGRTLPVPSEHWRVEERSFLEFSFLVLTDREPLPLRRAFPTLLFQKTAPPHHVPSFGFTPPLICSSFD